MKHEICTEAVVSAVFTCKLVHVLSADWREVYRMYTGPSQRGVQPAPATGRKAGPGPQNCRLTCPCESGHTRGWTGQPLSRAGPPPRAACQPPPSMLLLSRATLTLPFLHLSQLSVFCFYLFGFYFIFVLFCFLDKVSLCSSG